MTVAGQVVAAYESALFTVAAAVGVDHVASLVTVLGVCSDACGCCYMGRRRVVVVLEDIGAP